MRTISKYSTRVLQDHLFIETDMLDKKKNDHVLIDFPVYLNKGKFLSKNYTCMYVGFSQNKLPWSRPFLFTLIVVLFCLLASCH